MADSTSVDWGGFYSSLGAMPQQSGGMLVQQTPSDLTTRTVTTLPVNGSNWSNPTVAPNPYIGNSHWATQLPRSPANETYVPSSGVPFGNGPQAGYVPPGSYRLNPNPGMPSAAVDAINGASPSYIGRNHPALTLPKMASATPGGLPFATKYQSALRTAALMSQVGLAPKKPVTNVTAPMRRPNSLLDAVLGRPMTPVAALQARGISPSQAYAAANANAAALAQANATSGYTPSSSGRSNDYFSIAREGGSSSGGGIEGNGGITGYY